MYVVEVIKYCEMKVPSDWPDSPHLSFNRYFLIMTEPLHLMTDIVIWDHDGAHLNETRKVSQIITNATLAERRGS